MPIWKWDETAGEVDELDLVSFDSSMSLECVVEGVSFELNDGNVFELIGNAIQVPLGIVIDSPIRFFQLSISFPLAASISTDPVILTPIAFEFNFVNGIEIAWELNFLNALNTDLEKSFSFENHLTGSVSKPFSFENRILAVNEIQKNFTFFNRVLSDQSNEYNGFYFSRIHGV